MRPTLLALALLTSLAAAQDKPGPPPEAKPDAAKEKKSDKPAEPVTRDGSVTIDGKKIDYQVTTAKLVLEKDDGAPRASIFHVSYVKKNAGDVTKRPVLFAFNGGPGSSAVWLHLGTLGPKRVSLPGDGTQAPVPPAKLVPNEFSILDVADLVFVDPVSTGYSRIEKDDLSRIALDVRAKAAANEQADEDPQVDPSVAAFEAVARHVKKSVISTLGKKPRSKTTALVIDGTPVGAIKRSGRALRLDLTDVDDAFAEWLDARAQEPAPGQRIVNSRQYERLRDLVGSTSGTVVTGGVCDDAGLRIEPTVIRDPAPSDAVMASTCRSSIIGSPRCSQRAASLGDKHPITIRRTGCGALDGLFVQGLPLHGWMP